MVSHTWRLIARTATVLGMLFVFFVLVEMFRVFLLLYRLNAIVGWAYVGAVVLIGPWVLLSLLREWRAGCRTLRPPALPEQLQEADFNQLHAYCQYLMEYLDRFADNPSFDEDEQDQIDAALYSLVDALRAHPLRDDLIREIEQTEQQVIRPLLDKLEKVAAREIRHTARDVMKDVTLSPWHGMDVLVVIFRNAAMARRVARIFHGRQSAGEELLILRDIPRLFLTVNILDPGKHVFDHLLGQIPGIGRSLDDIGRGIGAGLLTAAVGEATIGRCATARKWDRNAAALSLAGQAPHLLTEIRDLLTRDILPGMKNRICSASAPDAVGAPGFWDDILRAVIASFDAAAKKPVDTPRLFTATNNARDGSGPHNNAPPHRHTGPPAHTARRRRTKHHHGTPRILRTFGQRLRYTFFPGR